MHRLHWQEDRKRLTLIDVEFYEIEKGRLKKIGTGRLEKKEHFYLSQPITLHPQNSIFVYLRTYPE